VTEELENSLRQTIETYLDTRLSAIDEQLSRLQSEFNEAFARLREVSASESLDTTPVSEAIAAHLQAAREQKLSGVTAAPSVQGASHVAAIKHSVTEIEKQESHADVLRALLTSALQFADRVAIFVIKNEQAIGWQLCAASDAARIESIRDVVLPLNTETLISHAARSQSVWTGEPGSNAEDQRLIDQLGGEAKSLAAVPLIVRGKVVAVLYADAASNDAAAINVDAIELLARVAAMAINLVSVATTPTQVSEPSTAMVQPATPAPSAQPSQTEEVSETEALYQPQVEPAAPVVAAPPVTDETVTPEVAEEDSSEPVAEEVVSASEAQVASAPEAESEPEPTPPAGPIESEPPSAPAAPVTPSFTANYATPLGTARRYGVTEPDLPIDVGEEERRLHNDARRFARLLVSEIKLYNEQKVKDGRSESNLYDRLREDIDRSRQMYDKRVAPPVAARHDYFHQELVNTLAEGDTSKLGASYPGASVAVS